MSEASIDFNEDPQKVFVNLLLRKLDGCYIVLFEYSDNISAIRRLIGIILTLSKGSKTNLDEKLDTLRKMMQGKLRRDTEAIEQIYSSMLDYLHDTYFKETFGAKPVNPRPRHIKNQEEDPKNVNA